MCMMQCDFIGPENAHAIGAGEPRQGEPAKLNQISQAMPAACDQNVTAGAVVIEKSKTRRFAGDNPDVERGQVAMNKAGPMQSGNFSSQRAQQSPFRCD